MRIEYRVGIGLLGTMLALGSDSPTNMLVGILFLAIAMLYPEKKEEDVRREVSEESETQRERTTEDT